MIARPILPSSHEIPAFEYSFFKMGAWEDTHLNPPVRTCAIMCVFVCCVYILPYSHREKER